MNALSHVKSDHRTVFILSRHHNTEICHERPISRLWALRYSDISGWGSANQGPALVSGDQWEQSMTQASIHQEETIILWCCILKEDAVKIFYSTGNSFVKQDSVNNLLVGPWFFRGWHKYLHRKLIGTGPISQSEASIVTQLTNQRPWLWCGLTSVTLSQGLKHKQGPHRGGWTNHRGKADFHTPIQQSLPSFFTFQIVSFRWVRRSQNIWIWVDTNQ